MRMHNPPYPRRCTVETVDFTFGYLHYPGRQAYLGISRKALSELVNEHTGISPEMAVRLSTALDTSSELWMNMQSSYDLWHAEQRRKELRVTSIVAA